MLVTCTCGKKLVFGDEPNEQQVCDRCGMKVSSPLAETAPEESREPGAPAQRKAAVPGPHKGALPHRFASSPISTRVMAVRDGEKERSKLGCVVVLLLLIGGPIAGDFILNPAHTLMCGHRGRVSYFYGAVPLGHTCPRLKALAHLNDARLEIARRGEGVPGTLDVLEAQPPARSPFTFAVGHHGLLAFPTAADSGEPSYLVESDGTVHSATGSDPTPDSPQVGTFAE